MQSIFRLVSIQVMFCFVVGCSYMPWSGDDAEAEAAFVPTRPYKMQEVSALDIKNLIQPEATKFVAGQPTEEQLEQLAEAGIVHIVNLRADEEMNFDEASLVKDLGMKYHSLVVDGDPDITKENASKLRDILDSIGDQPALLHDGSGGRVGALMGIDDAVNNGVDAEQAILTGKLWGLSGRIVPMVREALAK